jgi:1-acyl-sn-glycerol-3-phosphate acyltransferase
MAPVYGLAEAGVGLSFPQPGHLPIVDRVQREELSRRGFAAPLAEDGSNAVEFVACGRPLMGYELRVVDEATHELGDREEGHLQFRGPSATRGYYRNEADTRKLFCGDWLETGDLAYMVDGEVYITGRKKDVIIRAGRNIYPTEVEEVIGDLVGVRKGCVAVFGSHDPDAGTERVVVLAETRVTGAEELDELRRRVRSAATDVLETPPDDVVLAPPQTVLKTSSGKIRRAGTKELYEKGQLRSRPRSFWLQLVRLNIASLPTRTRRLTRTLLAWLYALYWWTVAGTSLAVTWVLVILLPRRRWRWAILHHAARFGFWLVRTPLTVEGASNVPRGRAILVANHASYLDGMVLSAAFPGEMLFAAKQEFEDQFFAGTPLRRIDTIFVERFDPRQSLAHTRTLVARAREGRRLMIFAEGTLSPAAGLMGFRLGAFQAAVQADVPIVPIAIRGTRTILRGGSLFPRRGKLTVHAGAPLQPQASDFSAAVQLRDAARQQVLMHCGEPDLA